MFYVITAKSIRKFLLWVLVLAILGWVVFALGSNRSQRDNFGTLADRWVIDFDRITIIPPPEEELDSSPPEEIEEPVLPTVPAKWRCPLVLSLVIPGTMMKRRESTWVTQSWTRRTV